MTTYSDTTHAYRSNGIIPVDLGVSEAINRAVMTIGTVFYVDAANGNDANEGKSPQNALATIAEAYDRCTANKHDVVALVGNETGHTLSEALDWAKNYTHLVGIAAPSRVGTRARIFQLSTLTGASPLLTISASGCAFKNFYIFQGVDDATSLINVQVTGGRNYYENVHFAGGGHATQAINGGASLALGGTQTCEESLFYRCTIGVDTVDAATGMMAMIFNGTEAHRIEFKECTFRMRAGDSAAGFVELMTTAAAIDRDIVFDNCLFINNSTSNDMASAFVIPATAAGEPHLILLKDCLFHNVTKLDANDRGMVFGNMNAITGADLSGVAVQLIT